MKYSKGLNQRKKFENSYTVFMKKFEGLEMIFNPKYGYVTTHLDYSIVMLNKSYESKACSQIWNIRLSAFQHFAMNVKKGSHLKNIFNIKLVIKKYFFILFIIIKYFFK